MSRERREEDKGKANQVLRHTREKVNQIEYYATQDTHTHKMFVDAITRS